MFEGNTGEFHGKTVVFRGEAASREQSPARVLPPSQLRQRAPAVVFEIWSGSCLRLERLYDLLPARLLEQLPDIGCEVRE